MMSIRHVFGLTSVLRRRPPSQLLDIWTVDIDKIQVILDESGVVRRGQHSPE
jgi:hypothetical protein